MCGFLVLANGSIANDELLRSRGPDASTFMERRPFDFRHFMLHITGQFLSQPLVERDVICLFNGEIYSPAHTVSDGEVIIPLYRRYGSQFARYLDGEYAIALYDFTEEKVTFSTDTFGTKPLWREGALCSSYRSALDGCEVPPNTTVVCSFDGKVLDQSENRSFDFRHQCKTSYHDWSEALVKAVAKRAVDGCYLGLSSGYDSGAIAATLNALGVIYKAFSILGDEDEAILTQRLKLADSTMLNVTSDMLAAERRFLEAACEPYNYHTDASPLLHVGNMHDDRGALGLSLIHRAAQHEGRRVCISGHGADEILSDYAYLPRVSTLQGVFPQDLMPWPNFYGRCQRAYLAKEEYVAGAHGVESRYPFLDPRLVQEFLWLTPELKNRAYKAPLEDYLRVHEYPFSPNTKIGFNIHPA